jgi:hypothetical protein
VKSLRSLQRDVDMRSGNLAPLEQAVADAVTRYRRQPTVHNWTMIRLCVKALRLSQGTAP